MAKEKCVQDTIEEALQVMQFFLSAFESFECVDVRRAKDRQNLLAGSKVITLNVRASIDQRDEKRGYSVLWTSRSRL